MSNKRTWDEYWEKKDYDITKNPLFYEAMKTLPKNKTALILEAGCGNGKWIFEFGKNGYKNVVGLDFSEVGLRKIRKTNKNAMLVKADIRNLPFKEETFNTTFSFGVIEHFNDPDPLIKCMYDCLKKNGTLFLDTPNLLSHHTIYRAYRKTRGKWVVGYEDSYTTFGLKRILRKHGFKIVKSGTRGKYNRFDVFGFLSFVVARK
jgi:SAM-dependent methyltransferase